MRKLSQMRKKERHSEISEREEEWVFAVVPFQADFNFHPRELWPALWVKEKQIFMRSFTVCKILGVDKVPCGCEPEKIAEKKRPPVLSWVSFPINFTRLSKRSIKASWAEQRQKATWHPSPLLLHSPATHTPKNFNERKLVRLCVLVRAQAKRLLLCTILSMSQRLRSLKITHGDRCGLRLIFFHSPLFVIRCQQNFLGVQTTAFMLRVSHGLMDCRASHSNTMQSGCKAKYTMSVCSLVAQAWIHIYLSTMMFIPVVSDVSLLSHIKVP